MVMYSCAIKRVRSKVKWSSKIKAEIEPIRIKSKWLCQCCIQMDVNVIKVE